MTFGLQSLSLTLLSVGVFDVLDVVYDVVYDRIEISDHIRSCMR